MSRCCPKSSESWLAEAKDEDSKLNSARLDSTRSEDVRPAATTMSTGMNASPEAERWQQQQQQQQQRRPRGHEHDAFPAGHRLGLGSRITASRKELLPAGTVQPHQRSGGVRVKCVRVCICQQQRQTQQQHQKQQLSRSSNSVRRLHWEKQWAQIFDYQLYNKF